MFGRRKRPKSPDMRGCPRCGAGLCLLSQLPTCTKCGPLQGPQFGYRIYARDIYTSAWGGKGSRAIRYEIDPDNPGRIGDRPGKMERALDR